MSEREIKPIEIIEKYGSYRNVISFNQTIYQNKTKKAKGEGYYYTLKTVVPRVIYDYLELSDDIIYLVDNGDEIVLSAQDGDGADGVYKRKLNKKSHNFTVPKQLFTEDVSSDFVASFIFIPSDSRVIVCFH